MTSEEYTTNRLQEQIDWYERSSGFNNNIFKILRIMEIVAAALIPFLSGLLIGSDNYKQTIVILVGVLGLIVTISSSLISLGRHQEKWIEYRKMAEALKREKFLFDTQVAPYDIENRFSLFVQTVEMLIAKENENWSQIMLKAQTEKSDNKK